MAAWQAALADGRLFTSWQAVIRAVFVVQFGLHVLPYGNRPVAVAAEHAACFLGARNDFAHVAALATGEAECVMVRRLRGFAGVRHQLKAIAWRSEANDADITCRLEVHPPQFAQLSDILSPQL